MSIDRIRKLKEALLATYGSFADRRIKNIDVGDRFIVDGRMPSDIASDGNVYGWFCSMFLGVKQPDEVMLSIMNIPTSPRVEEWLAKYAAAFGTNRIEIKRDQEAILTDLADRVKAITVPGSRYDVRHYKYAVPRVVSALNTLRLALAEGWGD